MPTSTTFTIALAVATGVYAYGGAVTPPFSGPSPYILSNTSLAAITGASWNANVATIAATNTFVAGQIVTVTGMTPNVYNGTYVITSANSTSFSYALPLGSNPGNATVFGSTPSLRVQRIRLSGSW